MTRQIPAVDGWFTTGPEPALVGHRCTSCGTHAFPFAPPSCPNPGCRSRDFEPATLSRRGTIWSYTDARYQPPAPYVAADPFTPFAHAAVELADEAIVILGQVAAGYTADQLAVGMEVELVTEPLYVDVDGDEHVIWRWKPLGVAPAGEPGPLAVLGTERSAS